MANPTAGVKLAIVPWGDDKRFRGLASTVQDYYPGEAIGIGSSEGAAALARIIAKRREAARPADTQEQELLLQMNRIAWDNRGARAQRAVHPHRAAPDVAHQELKAEPQGSAHPVHRVVNGYFFAKA